LEEEKTRGKKFKAGGAGHSWILAFSSIAVGISKVSFFRKMRWKKVNFSTKIY